MERNVDWLKVVSFGSLVFYFAAGFIGMMLFGSDALTQHIPQLWSYMLWKPYAIYFFAGTLGGAVYGIRLYFRYLWLDRLDLKRRWLWYATCPPIRGGVAAIAMVLFESEIMVVSVSDSLHAKIGLSFLIGFGYGKLIRKMEDTIASLFGSDPSDDRQTGSDDGGTAGKGKKAGVPTTNETSPGVQANPGGPQKP